MSVVARELLDIMTTRLSMIDAGITRPPAAVADATRRLVARLSALAPGESIEIRYVDHPFHAQYIWPTTGEILAEIRAPAE